MFSLDIFFSIHVIRPQVIIIFIIRLLGYYQLYQVIIIYYQVIISYISSLLFIIIRLLLLLLGYYLRYYLVQLALQQTATSAENMMNFFPDDTDRTISKKVFAPHNFFFFVCICYFIAYIFHMIWYLHLFDFVPHPRLKYLPEVLGSYFGFTV